MYTGETKDETGGLLRALIFSASSIDLQRVDMGALPLNTTALTCRTLESTSHLPVVSSALYFLEVFH
jgi:hypothetical protein